MEELHIWNTLGTARPPGKAAQHTGDHTALRAAPPAHLTGALSSVQNPDAPKLIVLQSPLSWAFPTLWSSLFSFRVSRRTRGKSPPQDALQSSESQLGRPPLSHLQDKQGGISPSPTLRVSPVFGNDIKPASRFYKARSPTEL